MAIDPGTVARYAPVVYFHRYEQYFPCSIEYLLQNAVLLDRNDSKFAVPNPSQATLSQYRAEHYYVLINASQFGGIGTSAPMYYAVQQYDDAIEISYLMLYAYQGGQTCRALRLGTEFDCIVKTYGIHQGDLERIVVTLIPQSGGRYRALRVGYEAHGDMTWYPTQSVAWENDTHPVVNIALNGHSSHNMLAQGDRVTEFEQPASVAVVSALGNDGQVWRPYDNGGLRLLGLDASGNPIGDQIWAAFAGRLGDAQTNELDSATYFDGSNLSGFDWAFVKLTDWAARLFDRYPEHLANGNGPGGPGARDWVRPSSGPLFGDALTILQSIPNTGQGSGAVLWTETNIADVGRDQLVQGWAGNSGLAMILYGANSETGTISTIFGGDMGEGAGAIAWLRGNFIGDERKEIVQAWSSVHGLGMTMYGANGSTACTKLWRNDNMQAGPGAVAWLTGDFNGDGTDEIVQAWNNDGSLGLILYGSDGNGGLKILWGSSNIGAGSGAIAWLVGDFFGAGRDEIVQAWNNGGALGLIRYGSDGNGGLKTLWGNSNIGAGSGAIAWFVGDFFGVGRDEIVQAWNNNGALGLIRYGSDGNGGLKTLWGVSNAGTGSGAKAWLAGNFSGSGRKEIVQAWNNGGSLGLTLYGSDGNGGLKTLWGSSNIGAGSGAVAWLSGNFYGNDRDQIIQCWDNHGALGLIAYGTV